MKSTKTADLGKFIKLRRKKLKISQCELAAFINVSQPKISKLELGIVFADVSFSEFYALSIALKFNAGSILKVICG